MHSATVELFGDAESGSGNELETGQIRTLWELVNSLGCSVWLRISLKWAVGVLEIEKRKFYCGCAWRHATGLDDSLFCPGAAVGLEADLRLRAMQHPLPRLLGFLLRADVRVPLTVVPTLCPAVDDSGWLQVLGDMLAARSGRMEVEDEGDACCKPSSPGLGILPQPMGVPCPARAPCALPPVNPLCLLTGLELFPERCRCWGRAVDCTEQDLATVPWVSSNVTRM